MERIERLRLILFHVEEAIKLAGDGITNSTSLLQAQIDMVEEIRQAEENS